VILVDANLILYAYDTSSAAHEPARAWWQRCLSEPEPVRLAWATILAFLRIGTNPRALRWPMTIEEATEHVATWLERPMVAVLEPTERHLLLLRRLLVQGQATANLVADAHLAALAMEHGATLCSTDADFSRFRGLAWTNPLRP
jgi:toxin-antitoxin system PIN domain toxin